MRIATICRPETPNARYRAILPLAELGRRGHTILWPDHPSFHQLESGGTPKWDLLHIQQFLGEDDVDTIRRLQANGIAVVWDSDDDILGAPKGSESYKRLGGRRKLRKYFDRSVEIASAANLMTTTNEHLAQIYRDAGVEHVQAIENYVAVEDVGRARVRHQGIVVGLCAANEHVHDLKQLRIAEVLERLLREHEGVQVIALGLDLKLRGHRYLHHPRVPIARLLEIERGFDIGLAPLVDSAMSRSRSNVKLKEYAASGAMWLASPVGPYVGMGEAQGGLLVEDGDWHATLDQLIRDHTRRLELAKRAQAWARRQTVAQAADVWTNAFRGAVMRARAGKRSACSDP